MSDYVASRSRLGSRWWLAGLLVGCLLPAGLVQGNAARLSVRIVHACLLAPAAIRAESRRHARKRYYSVSGASYPTSIAFFRPADLPGWAKPDLARPSIGLDTFSRRGPPCPSEV